jgi:hypothetical protein
MRAINDLELVLIELQYAAADNLHCKATTSDPLELADLGAELPKIRAAMLAVKFALDSMQTFTRSRCTARAMAMTVGLEPHASRALKGS